VCLLAPRNAEIARDFLRGLAALGPRRIRIAGREFGIPGTTPAADHEFNHDDRALELTFGCAADYLI
jgi:hypothetical protein